MLSTIANYNDFLLIILNPKLVKFYIVSHKDSILTIISSNIIPFLIYYLSNKDFFLLVIYEYV